MFFFMASTANIIVWSLTRAAAGSRAQMRQSCEGVHRVVGCWVGGLTGQLERGRQRGGLLRKVCKRIENYNSCHMENYL